MKFESKYDVGQTLWEIELECKTDLEKCLSCGHTIFYGQQWKLNNTQQEIHGIGMQEGAIYYKVWKPYVYREMLPESDIGRTYFISKEDALLEVERLNKELEVEKYKQFEARVVLDSSTLPMFEDKLCE